MSDEDCQALQIGLLLRPEQGPLIKGGGGLRKVRLATRRAGKRGGIRLIYYWNRSDSTLYVLFAYAKSVQEDLTADQLRILARIVREELK